jgi:hypothetical protein
MRFFCCEYYRKYMWSYAVRQYVQCLKGEDALGYYVFLVLLLPQLEHSLRLLYSIVNTCQVHFNIELTL